MEKIGYLGPRGTNSEEALLKYTAEQECECVSLSSISDVIKAVEDGTADKGIVPIENSIEGSVNETLDMLAFETEKTVIEGEITIPVSHNLIANPGLAMEDIKAVVSLPHATAQCRHFLQVNLANIPVIAANSTAEAVIRVAEHPEELLAAIGTRLAAEIHNLNILAVDIEDFKDNRTRFGIVGREQAPPTGKDKTSVVCFIHEDRPGSLLQILQELAFRYINLTKIQSRPTKKALGDYCFFLDMEGHINDPVIADALKCLRCKIRAVKVLGSYPRG